MPLPDHDMTPLLSVRGLTKTFGSLVAVDDVFFEVMAGEVHCLLGENGAGKSTLSSCLYGLHRPDAGEILIEGNLLDLRSPADALAAGIGMVHQHFVLVPAFTVLENIVVGTGAGWRLDVRGARSRIEAICEHFGITLAFDRLASDLAVGEQQWVEIVKALYLGARLLILDEPTSSLTPEESEKLFGMIREMAASGIGVILITHKMGEVLRSDRVTVLRKGRRIDTVETKKTSRAALTRMMIGRELADGDRRDRDQDEGEIVLRLERIGLLNQRGRRELDAVSFELRAGEILGIAGVAGNGQSALFEIIAGIRRPSAGNIFLGDRSIRDRSISAIARLGLGYVPNDRLRDGLVPDFSISENVILGHQWDQAYRTGPFLDASTILERGRQAIADYAVAAPGPETAVKKLSGGNAQKMILAREFAKASRCLLCHQPTRGLDVGVITHVHGELRRLRDDGVAILLASEELDELLALADRLAVMFEGRVLGIFSRHEIDLRTIGALMAGHDETAAG